MGSRRRPRRPSPGSEPSAPPPAGPEGPPLDAGLPARTRRAYLPVAAVAAVVAVALALALWPRGGDGDRAVTRPWPPPVAAPADAAPVFEDFVGAETCGECHAPQYEAWAGSTHGRAGGWPEPNAIIAPFDGAPMRFRDAVVVPSVNDRGEYLFTVRRDGVPETVFRVDGVIGRGHMVGGGTQGFVSEFPDGTIRFLPFDYIRGEGVWFCNTNTRTNEGWIPITPDMALADCGDWPPVRVLGAEARFGNCQECHGSQIIVRFDGATGRYDTKVKSYRVNCESCHGPGARHVDLARTGGIDASADIAIQTFATVDKDASLEVCFRCHALKGVIEPGYLPGTSLEAHYSLKTPLLGEEPLFPDGRIRTFAYQQNHLYSDCYISGSMTCVDCHQPHASEYQDIYGRPLANRFDDGQCLSCHPSKGEDVTRHTMHAEGSPGSQCVACHMPYLQHPELGTALRFARSDHTIPIPRPAFDDSLGVLDACSQCHGDRPVAELDRQTRAWYGELKPHKEIIAGVLASGDGTADVSLAAERLLHPETDHPIAQVDALNLFLDVLRPNMPALDAAIVGALQRLAVSRDIDVRATALAALHLARGQDPSVRAFLGERLAAFGDLDAPMRGRWTVVLGYLADRYRAEGEVSQAMAAYRKALEVRPDYPPVLHNLALTMRDAGDYPGAIRIFRQALARDSLNALGWVNLGVTLEGAGSDDEAAEVYRHAIAVNPGEPLAHFNLGNHYLRREEYREAIRHYRDALAFDAGLARAHYYLARAYVFTNQAEQALREARLAVEFEPGNASAAQMVEQLTEALRQRGGG